MPVHHVRYTVGARSTSMVLHRHLPQSSHPRPAAYDPATASNPSVQPSASPAPSTSSTIDPPASDPPPSSPSVAKACRTRHEPASACSIQPDARLQAPHPIHRQPPHAHDQRPPTPGQASHHAVAQPVTIPSSNSTHPPIPATPEPATQSIAHGHDTPASIQPTAIRSSSLKPTTTNSGITHHARSHADSSRHLHDPSTTARSIAHGSPHHLE
ncbi:hypothetical protein ACLOJK_011533 [Asimina triloba]